MALESRHDEFPRLIHLSLTARFNNRQQTTPHHSRRRFNPGNFENRGGQIDQAHQVNHTPTRRHAFWPLYGQWNTDSGVVQVAFGSREWIPMVTGHNHQRVLQLPDGFQRLQHPPEVRVKVFNF